MLEIKGQGRETCWLSKWCCRVEGITNYIIRDIDVRIRNTLNRLRVMGVVFQFQLIQHHRYLSFPRPMILLQLVTLSWLHMPIQKALATCPPVGLLMPLPSVLSAPWPYSQSLGLWPIPLLVLAFLWIETLAHSCKKSVCWTFVFLFLAQIDMRIRDIGPTSYRNISGTMKKRTWLPRI